MSFDSQTSPEQVFLTYKLILNMIARLEICHKQVRRLANMSLTCSPTFKHVLNMFVDFQTCPEHVRNLQTCPEHVRRLKNMSIGFTCSNIFEMFITFPTFEKTFNKYSSMFEHFQ